MSGIPLSYDRSVYWYRLACAGLFTVAGLAALGLIPALGLLSHVLSASDGPTLKFQLGGAAVESLFATVLALVAGHLRDFASRQSDLSTIAGGIMLTTMRERRSRFQRLGPHPWGAEEDVERPISVVSPETNKNAKSSVGPRKNARAQMKDIGGRNVDDLAKQLESDRMRVSRFEAGQKSAAPKSRRDENALSERRPSLSREDKGALYGALSKGTVRRLGREPTVPELARLVAFISEESPSKQASDLFMTGAFTAGLEIHWNGRSWAFERPESPSASSGSNTA